MWNIKMRTLIPCFIVLLTAVLLTACVRTVKTEPERELLIDTNHFHGAYVDYRRGDIRCSFVLDGWQLNYFNDLIAEEAGGPAQEE